MGRDCRALSSRGVGMAYPHTIHLVTVVVVGRALFLFLLRNHFITENVLKKKSGDVNDEANFSLFILLHKRAKPILPPGRANSKPSPSARTQTLYSPLTLTLRSPIRPYLTHRLEPLGSIKPLVLPMHPYLHPPLRARTQTLTLRLKPEAL
jgi:hypothetical protein